MNYGLTTQAATDLLNVRCCNAINGRCMGMLHNNCIDLNYDDAATYCKDKGPGWRICTQ